MTNEGFIPGIDDAYLAYQRSDERKPINSAQKPTVRNKAEPITKVEVTNIDMKFWYMVWFMVKWALATIPAILILALTFALVKFFSVPFLGLLAALIAQ